MKMTYQWGNIEISETPNPDYQSWQKATNSYFDGESWGRVLQGGFKAKRYYLWDKKNKTGLSLTVFKQGPFRMGFLGFPACVMHWEGEAPYELDEMVEAACKMPKRPHLLRIAPSEFANIKLHTKLGKKATTIETCITALQRWSVNSNEKMKRAWNRANKKCSEFIPQDPGGPNSIYSLYKAAIDKNQGKSKYSLEYFDAIYEEVVQSKINLKMIESGSTKSMLVYGRHGNVIYYLHGGSTPEAMRIGASDFLMKQAIDESKEKGLQKFNFLSSPGSQQGLIKFKEKWGGESRPVTTHTIPTGLVGRLLLFLSVRAKLL